jgi:hypothetical protein
MATLSIFYSDSDLHSSAAQQSVHSCVNGYNAYANAPEMYRSADISWLVLSQQATEEATPAGPVVLQLFTTPNP